MIRKVEEIDYIRLVCDGRIEFAFCSDDEGTRRFVAVDETTTWPEFQRWAASQANSYEIGSVRPEVFIEPSQDDDWNEGQFNALMRGESITINM